MNKLKAKKLTEKIVAIILEEQNGYSKTDAIKLAPECEGDTVWTKIENLLVKQKLS